MAVRFRKSIPVAKGVRVNVGKRGASVSLGGKMGGITIGKQKRARVSIPGSGISYSTSLSSGNKRSSSKSKSRGFMAEMARNAVVNSIVVEMDDEGNFLFLDSKTGNPVSDDAIAIYKKDVPGGWTNVKKRVLENHIEEATERAEEFNAEQRRIFEMGQLAPVVTSKEDFIAYRDDLEPDTYAIAEYAENPPKLIDFENEAEEYAKSQIKGLFKKPERAKLAASYQQELFDEAMAAYNGAKAEFDAQQLREKERYESEALEECKREVAAVNALLANDNEEMNQQVEQFIQDIELPVDIAVAYEIAGDTICIDLDLPEIEDFPCEEAVVQKNGAIKYKGRKQADLKADYAHCVSGLALFIASNMFCILPTIEKALVSGYTQRRNKDGEIDDTYVFSVVFNRTALIGRDLAEADPESVLMEFQNRYSKTSTSMLKKIKPFELADIE